MTFRDQLPLASALIFFAAPMIACGGATEPVVQDTSETRSGASKDDPKAPSEASSPAPPAPSGSSSSSSPPPAPPSDPGETCGGPPPTAFCSPCPGGIDGYKQINGKPTCDCCAVPLPACTLPPEPGPCAAVFMRWAFDAKAGKCEPLQWGGCGGNANNFETEEECEKACSP